MLRVGEYGFTVRLNASFDLTAATALQINVTRPDSSTTTFIPTRGTSLFLTQSAGVFQANEYVEYVALVGDFASAGDFILSLQADFGPSQRLISSDVILPVAVGP